MMMKNMVLTALGDIDEQVWNEYIMTDLYAYAKESEEEAEVAEYIHGNDPVPFLGEDIDEETETDPVQQHLKEKARHAARRKKGYTLAKKRSKWDTAAFTAAFVPGCEAMKYSQNGRYFKGHVSMTSDHFAQRSAIRRDQAASARLADYYDGNDYSLTAFAAEFALCCDPGEKPVDPFINI